MASLDVILRYWYTIRLHRICPTGRVRSGQACVQRCSGAVLLVIIDTNINVLTSRPAQASQAQAIYLLFFLHATPPPPPPPPLPLSPLSFPHDKPPFTTIECVRVIRDRSSAEAASGTGGNTSHCFGRGHPVFDPTMRAGRTCDDDDDDSHRLQAARATSTTRP